jgi:hypothetical protein
MRQRLRIRGTAAPGLGIENRCSLAVGESGSIRSQVSVR